MKNLIKSISECIKKYKNIFRGLILSIIFCFMIYYIERFLAFNFSKVMYVCILGPLFEEYLKRLSIILKFTLIFAIFFPLYEFVFHIFRYPYVGILEFFKFRTSVIVLHLITILYQKYFYDKSIKYKDNSIGDSGFMGALLIHSLWNTFAVMVVGG